MDMHRTWQRVSSHGHNQLCRILFQSSYGFWFCGFEFLTVMSEVLLLCLGLNCHYDP